MDAKRPSTRRVVKKKYVPLCPQGHKPALTRRGRSSASRRGRQRRGDWRSSPGAPQRVGRLFLDAATPQSASRTRAPRERKRGDHLKRDESRTWLGTRDVARICGKTDRCIRYWVQANAIPVVRETTPKSKHRFLATELLEWIPENKHLVKDPEAIYRLIAIMSIGEVPKPLLLDYITRPTIDQEGDV